MLGDGSRRRRGRMLVEGIGSGESAEGVLLRCMDECTMDYMYRVYVMGTASLL